MVFGAAQGLLSLEARRVCVARLGVLIAGQVKYNLTVAYLSVVSPERGDSDWPQQTPRTEDCCFYYEDPSLMWKGLIPGLILFPSSRLAV